MTILPQFNNEVIDLQIVGYRWACDQCGLISRFMRGWGDSPTSWRYVTLDEARAKQKYGPDKYMAHFLLGEHLQFCGDAHRDQYYRERSLELEDKEYDAP